MSALVGKLSSFGGSLASKGGGVLDSIFPPEKRAELLARAKAFILKNPKVSAFLLTNIALTGGPLVLFTLFSISIFVFALIVALVIALLVAVAFTLFAVGVALLILFPTIFFTTLAATFLFLWALGGYYIFKKFNKDSSPGAKGDTIGDKLNALTGNKLDFVMDNARLGMAEQRIGPSQEDWKEPSGQNAKTAANHETKSTPKKSGPQRDSEGNSTSADAKKTESPMNGVKKGANGVKKRVNPEQATNAVNGGAKTAGLGDAGDKVKGAPKKLGQAPGQLKGTATGTVGGATGLM